MKLKFIYLIIACLGINTISAQAPNGFSYQTALRNASGAILSSTNVSLRFTIRDGSPTGTVLYQETHSKTTTSLGIVNLFVGTGNIVQGTFPSIAQWSSGTKYLQVELDPAGGSSYTDLGATQIMSVPYANYANGASSATNATNATNLTGNINPNQIKQTGASTGQVLKWDGSTWAPQNDIGGGVGDNWGSQSAATDATLSGNGTSGSPLKLAQNSATNGQVLKWNGSGWAPGTDNTGSGSGDNWGTQVVVGSSPLTGDGTATTPLKIAQNGAVSGDALTWNGTNWSPQSTGWTVSGSNVLKNNGFVGIGTTTPLTKFHLAGTNTIGTLEYRGNSWMALYNRNTYIGYFGNYTDSLSMDFGTSGSGKKVHLVTSAAPRLTVDGQNVGIGLQNPVGRLHVLGTNSSAYSYLYGGYSFYPSILGVPDTNTSSTSMVSGVLGVGKGGSFIAAGTAGIAGAWAANNFGGYFEAEGTTNTTRRNYGTYTEVIGSGTLSVGSFIGYEANSNTTNGNYGATINVSGTSSTFSIGLYSSAAVTASTATNYGIYGTASGGSTNYAGYFQGNTYISGTLSKTAGTFKIDHPLDPENKYLIHSFVESPDMMNIYNGNITTDANGYAIVQLPSYFEALNMDFRYQLTVLGPDFAQAIVVQKIEGNQFKIKTDKPNIEVSWQVTGVRQDNWAKQNRIVPEVQKEPNAVGKYLNPEVFGKPANKGIHYIDNSIIPVKKPAKK